MIKIQNNSYVRFYEGVSVDPCQIANDAEFFLVGPNRKFYLFEEIVNQSTAFHRIFIT